MSGFWDIRLHKIFYPDAGKALYSVYGQPRSLGAYCMKSLWRVRPEVFLPLNFQLLICVNSGN